MPLGWLPSAGLARRRVGSPTLVPLGGGETLFRSTNPLPFSIDLRSATLSAAASVLQILCHCLHNVAPQIHRAHRRLVGTKAILMDALLHYSLGFVSIAILPQAQGMRHHVQDEISRVTEPLSRLACILPYVAIMGLSQPIRQTTFSSHGLQCSFRLPQPNAR